LLSDTLHRLHHLHFLHLMEFLALKLYLNFYNNLQKFIPMVYSEMNKLTYLKYMVLLPTSNWLQKWIKHPLLQFSTYLFVIIIIFMQLAQIYI
jgi:hypothetical protein